MGQGSAAIRHPQLRSETMAARNLSSSPRLAAGNAAPKIIAVVLVLAVAGVGAWFFFGRGSGPAATSTQATQAPAEGGAASAGATTPTAAATPALDSLSVDQLYKEARAALNEQRMVSPVGNNALEYYIKILEKQPSDSGARDAIREMFSTFASSAESAISARNFDEGKRIMDLLAKADPNNYTLTILKSKLDAQQKLAEREQAQAQAKAEAEARRAAEKDNPATAAASPTPAAASPTPAAAAPAAAAPKASTASASATPEPAAAAPAPKPAGETRDAQLVRQAPVAYPQAAVRRRDEGWVEVEFSVMPDGSIANARVVDSQPARIFDRAAIDSVQRWVFNPALKDGQPVQATLRRRIEFKMGGG